MDIHLDEKLKLSSRLVSVEQCPDLLPEDFIYQAKRKGKIVPIFKVLLSNICYNDCFYCANRSKRDCVRYKFKISEVVKVFLKLYSEGKVGGIFISSGIYNRPEKVQADILKIVEILRDKYRYSGYIHSKVIPGADRGTIQTLFRFSDRVSVNLEAPGERYLKKIAPHKNFLNLYSHLKDLAVLSKKYNLRAGTTTQLIVGIGEEDDRTILNFAYRLYTRLGIKRVYYSGFQPVRFTPLEEIPQCRELRIKRLYQADYLLRLYNFKPHEFVYDSRGNLVLEKDPKLAWAEKNSIQIDVNKAGFDELIRIPGIGHKLGYQIMNLRAKKRITLKEFKKIGLDNAETLKFIKV